MRRLFWSRHTKWWVRLLPLLVVAYVLSPIDLVPDVVPIVGLLDDLGVIGFVVAALWRELRRIPDGDDAP